jgi:hypothetical protein
MNETTKPANGTTHPPTEPPSGAPVPGATPPTRVSRQTKIWVLQNEALRRPDPLRANLCAMEGDLMLLAVQFHGMLEDILSDATNSPAHFAQLQQKGDYYLKVVHVLTRLVQADQQIARTEQAAQAK